MSDMQFGRNHLFGGVGQVAVEDHLDSLFHRLHADLRLLREEDGLRPDLLIVSGDLAEWGMKSEFKRAHEFLAGLCEALELPRTRVAIVPGNHDLNRKSSEAYFARCEANEEDPVYPYPPKWEHFAAMFDDFYEGAHRFTLQQEQWSLFVVEDLKVAVAGMNSTMKERHDADFYGHVGEEQLEWFAERLAPYRERGWLRIGVVHHNVQRGVGHDEEHLHDAETLRQRLGDRLNLLMHGHTHNAKLHWLEPTVPILSTGSAGLEEKARPAHVPNQYQLVRVRRDSMERWARRYERDLGHWVGDTRVSKKGDAWRDGVKVAFEHVDATFGAAPEAPAEPRPERKRDDFLERIADICRLRWKGAELSRHGTDDGWQYLHVVLATEGVFRTYPVGGLEHGAAAGDLERFAEQVHRRYRSVDPMVQSELVFGGPPAPPELVREASKAGIRLVSFMEYQGVHDLRGYVAMQTRALEQDPIYPPSLYVPQRYEILEGGEQDPPPEALEAILHWLVAPHGRFVLVLGDFGTGKTFLLHEVARRVPVDYPHIFPVLIDLRQLEKARRLDELVAQHFAPAGESVRPRTFRYMLEEGRIALLFDGFDELVNRITYDRAGQHLATLLDAASGRAKVVVTSRSQHFLSTQDVMRMLAAVSGRRIVSLHPFDETQILSFLARQCGDEELAAKRLARIQGIHDLGGLSTNPRMLSFIAQLDDDELDVARAADGGVTAADLYRLLIERWLDHEYVRAQPPGSPPTLSANERREAATAIAVHLWRRTERAARLSDLEGVVAQRVDDLTRYQLDPKQAAFILGSGTLLVRHGDDEFTFVHQSVLEWLVAFHAADQLPEHGGELGRQEMSDLMVDFFCDLAGREAALEWARAVAADPAGAEIAKTNALKVLKHLDEQPETHVELAGDLRGSDFSGQVLSGTTIERADISGTIMVGTELVEASLREVRAHDVRLDDAKLMAADLRSTDFAGASLTGADLSGADLTGARLDGARLMGADLRGARLERTSWRRAALIGARFDPPGPDPDASFGATTTDRALPELQVGAGEPGGALAFSPDGELLASGSNWRVALWDARSGRGLRRLGRGPAPVMALCFDAAGRRLVVAGHGLHVWDLAAATWSLMPLPGAGADVAAAPDGRCVAVASGGRVHVVDLDEQRIVRTPRQDHPTLTTVAYSHDGSLLAAAGGHVTLVWELAADEPPTVIEGEYVRCLAFSPVEPLLAIGGSSGLRLWDARTGALSDWAGDEYRVTSVDFSPDGWQLATTAVAENLRVWQTGAPPGGPASVELEEYGTEVAHSPDGTLLAVGRAHGHIQLIERKSVGHTAMLDGSSLDVEHVAFSPDGGSLVAAGARGVTARWEIAAGLASWRVGPEAGRQLASAFSPNGLWVALAGGDGAIRLCSAIGGRVAEHYRGHVDWVRSVAFSPGGDKLASAADDNTVRVWESPHRAATLIGEHPTWVKAVAFHPDGRRLISGSMDGTVHQWKLSQPSKPFATHELGDGLVGMALDDEGDRWLTWGGGEGVTVWSFDKRKRVSTLDAVGAATFGPGGTVVAAFAADGHIHLFDARTGRRRGTLADELDRVNALAFDPTGRRLAAACGDGAVRIWDLERGDEWQLALIALDDGWASVARDGRYKIEGTPSGEFWFTSGLCRFEPGELDEWVPDLLRVPLGQVLL